MNGRAARQRAQEFVCGSIQVMRMPASSSRSRTTACTTSGMFWPISMRGHGAQRELRRAERVERETGTFPLGAVLEHASSSCAFSSTTMGSMRSCEAGGRAAALSLQLLVEHALVRGMHVHEHEAGAILGKDVDAVELRDGGAERLVVRRLRRRTSGRDQSRRIQRLARGCECCSRRSNAPCSAGLCDRTGRPIGGDASLSANGAATASGRARFGCPQASAHCAKHEVVNLPAIPEAHFELRGMRIHVHELRIERQIQHVRGMPPAIEHIAIRQAHGIHQQTIAHARVRSRTRTADRVVRARRWAAQPSRVIETRSRR